MAGEDSNIVIDEKILKNIRKINMEYSKYVTHFIGKRSTPSVTSMCAAISFLNDPNREHLSLSAIDVTQTEILEFCKALEKNYSLLSLTFKDVAVGDDGAHAICKALETKKLKSIRLSNSDIGDAGMEAIAKLVEKNKYIQRLKIENNIFTSAGVATLCSVLKDNITLQSLEISKNNIGNEGSISIAEMLKCNETLELVSIEEGKIDDAGIIELGKYFEVTQNRARRLRFYMDKNKIGTSGKLALENAKKNPFFIAKIDRMEFSLQTMQRSGSKRGSVGNLVQIKEEVQEESTSPEDTTEPDIQPKDELVTKTIIHDEEIQKEKPKEKKKMEIKETQDDEAVVASVAPKPLPIEESSDSSYIMPSIGLIVVVASVAVGIAFYFRRRST